MSAPRKERAYRGRNPFTGETAGAERRNLEVNTASRDYTTDIHPLTGKTLAVEIPNFCGDCDRPIFYDYADEAYHHIDDPARGCFLIPAEEQGGFERRGA